MKKRIRIISLITVLILLALAIASAFAFVPEREEQEDTQANTPQTEITVGSISPIAREDNIDTTRESAEVELDISQIPRDTDPKLKGSDIQYGKKETDNK